MTEDQLKKRRAAAFRKKIRTIFISTGFTYINTVDKHFLIGHRDTEVDAVFLYENILLVCEDTTSAEADTDHIRRKNEEFQTIHDNFSEFIEWLCVTFQGFEPQLRNYSSDRYRVFNLYIAQNDLKLSADQLTRYSNIRFIEPQTLCYFDHIAQCIKLSARLEIFRYLGVKKEQVGRASSDSGSKSISAPIIYPKDTTGQMKGVRVVSFMISAELLMSTCYVLRKDNWEDSIWLYQRLIDKKKIRDIRKFLATKEVSFFNNIIVGLPDSVRFKDKAQNTTSIDKIGDFEPCELVISEEWNSICVIDGQHRIFAHYVGPETDKQESKIAQLRAQLHLLVTGLVFPPEMPPIQRAQIQSEIFLEINSKSTPVSAEVITHIEMIRNPYSDIGLARRVIELLNKEGVFQGKFQLSSVEESKIKVASIIKFALRYLVTISPAENHTSLYTLWNGDKDAFISKNENALNDYLSFCTKNLRTYFGAVKKHFLVDWNNLDSKLLSVISLNGFIIAYTRQLKSNGVRDFNFYDAALERLEIDFSKQNFGFTSSQYHKFSDLIIQEAFQLPQDVI